MSDNFYSVVSRFKKEQGCSFPNASRARKLVRRLFETLFICKNEADNTSFEIRTRLQKLQRQLQVLLSMQIGETAAAEQAGVFFQSVPNLYEKLLKDAEAIYNADPAARTLQEVLVAYPGFFAIAVHRFAHKLYQQGLPLLPRIVSEYAHSKTGIDIHPGASIGHSFVIDHGTGVVIGETAVIGNNVKIFQGVTLGALSVAKEKKSQKRHPTIGDNVVVYSGATILGGNTTVGHDSVIGGNVWLTESVQPFSVVLQQADVTVQNKRSFVEPYNFSI
jgi:serine O-acetyltransferase